MTATVDSRRQQLGVVLVFVVLAALAGGVLQVVLGYSLRDAAILPGVALVWVLVRLVLDEASF